jgi:hypothetical protein
MNGGLSGERLVEGDRDLAALLLWVGVRGFVERGDLERRWPAARPLPRLANDGLLQLDGEFVLLTPKGDAELTAGLRRSAAGDVAGLARFFTAFAEMDLELKQLATDWQSLRPRVADDPDALMGVIERWAALDGRLREAVAGSSAANRLLAAYLPPLEAARSAFDGGDWNMFTGVGEDSYHSIWYLMHETLLRALARERTG